MSTGPSRPMDFATLLWRQLPAVFRERDGFDAPGGDLAQLLGVWGELLDAFYRTLLQRYYDIFPEREGVDGEGLERGCQPWVLPYIADLLDVQLLSPLESGQRLEVGRAVAWRQRKGTLRAIEEVVDAVTASEVEVQEGWRRLALTPRAGFTLLSAGVFGSAVGGFDPRFPARMAEHPGLPGGTVDLRRAARALAADPSDPASKRTRFQGEEVWWVHGWRHGVPCFAGSFQDPSARTADLRTPDWRRGHAHPRRVLLYLPPFPGFFADSPISVPWSQVRDAVAAALELPPDVPTPIPDQPLEVERVTRGREADAPPLIRLAGTAANPVRLSGLVELDLAADWRFEHLWFDNTVELLNARAEFTDCALRELHVHPIVGADPQVVARGSLFLRLLAPLCRIDLAGVTVLQRLVAEHLEASDGIFEVMPRANDSDAEVPPPDVPATGCLRYCRLPYVPVPPDPEDPTLPNDSRWLSQGRRSALRVHRCNTEVALYWQTEFGRPGCAVLYPSAPPQLRFGAEDGGEMGACHDLRYTLREQAALDKLKDFLPVGLEAVLVPDASLICAPPQPRSNQPTGIES